MLPEDPALLSPRGIEAMSTLLLFFLLLCFLMYKLATTAAKNPEASIGVGKALWGMLKR
jgi:hypothetical protein